MKSRFITTIPVYNGAEFLEQTLQSLARQTLKPDRVILLDDGSTDPSQNIAKKFSHINCEWSPNPAKLGLFGNFNRCLDFAAETEYLHILHQDDTIEPKFYEEMTSVLADCEGLGMAWCLDERIDENNKQLSISGKPDGGVEVLQMNDFLKKKAEIGNQAFAATLLKTNYEPIPCRFPMDMPILGDMVYWAHFGRHCKKLVHLRKLLAKYRWHGANATSARAPSIQALILDEWKTMELNERLWSPNGMSLARGAKLRGLLAVLSGIKAKRFRQAGNSKYAADIRKSAKAITGIPLWLAGQFLVELREIIVFKILGRPRHPNNVFS